MSVASRHWVVVARRVLEAAPLLLLLDPLRQVLESRMLFHMMIEFPVLFAAGWSFGTRLRRGIDALDAHGLLGVTVASAVAAFWMIPAALDASLLSLSIQLSKVAVWWLTGALLGRSWPRLSAETKVFFLGNLAWMAATVGLLYQSTERRLCANYLFDDQQLAGSALVVLGVLLGGLAVACMLHSTAGGSIGLPARRIATTKVFPVNASAAPPLADQVLAAAETSDSQDSNGG